MYLRVRNVGRGRTYETEADVRNLSGRGVLLRAGRFTLGSLAPGDEREVEFTFEVLRDFDRDDAKLEVSVTDTELREFVTERVDIPISEEAAQLHARTGSVTVADGATIRSLPAANGDAIARIHGGALALPAAAELDGFVRVGLGDGRPGWVASSDLASSGSGGSIEWHVNHMPPRLDVTHSASLVTREDSVRLHGTARDDQEVRDVYVFVGSRKVFYQSNRGSDNRRELTFDANVRLSGGINYVTVIARESDDVMSRETFVLRRDAADGSLMETPSYDEHEFGGFLDDEEME